MSQSTDTTQVLPLADSPQAQVDPDATVTMPVVAPVSATMPTETAEKLYPSAPAVPVVPEQPAFDPVRARLLHLHRVLGRILNTAGLPTPDQVTMHAYGNGIELLVRNDLDGSALKPFADLFGGDVRSMDNDSKWAESGRARYAQLLTVVDGAEVSVWSLTDLPVVEQPVEEPQQAYCCGNPEDHAHPAEAAEPEPQHDPAPAPAPETPVEHPEAA